MFMNQIYQELGRGGLNPTWKGRCKEFEGGVNALEAGGRGVNTVKTLTFEKAGVHDPPPLLWWHRHWLGGLSHPCIDTIQ